MSQICSRCGMPVRPGFKFCNVCGAPIEEAVNFEENVESYTPLLGKEGRTIRILSGENAGRFVAVYPSCTVGRSGAGVDVADDDMISPIHFLVEAADDGVRVSDQDSLNGVIVRITDKVVLHNNDIIRAGDHYFLYEAYPTDKLEEDFGAEFYASPSRGERFRLVEILSGGRRGRACTAPDGIAVGRSDGDFLIPDDPRMSAKHFTIRWTQRGGILVDHSLNGTFVQIHEPTLVAEGDVFFAGNTLFRVC